jgi:glycosyltransferase involved in cell wall biosynthesis
MISIVLPVHNKLPLIQKVLHGILAYSSSSVKELIIVIDGCTDGTDIIIKSFLKYYHVDRHMRFQLIYTDNVYEVKACNVGYRACTQPYIINIQDDMVINIPDFDVRLIKPMVWKDVFAVTALAAYDIGLNEDFKLYYYHVINCLNYPQHIFAVRDVVNRGPLLFRHSILAELGYLDEAYAPMGMDDMDICMRAYEKGYVAGVYPMPAFFKLEDGTTRNNPTSAQVLSDSQHKNEPILIARHRAAITGAKHSEDRLLE